MTTVPPAPTFKQVGFSLTEMAVVLVIVALLMGGMMLPLNAQREARMFADTQNILANAKEALLSFAATNERLPCPATANSSGRETFCKTGDYPCSGAEEYEYYDTAPTSSHNGVCYAYYGGYLPAATLGIQPTDSGGFAIDSWGDRPINRIRYAVSTNALRSNETYPPTAYVLTKYQGLKSAILKPDLSVCSAGAQLLYSGTYASGLNNYAQCVSGYALVKDAAAIVYSLGKNAPSGGISADESPNITVDTAFVSANQSSTFDDQLVWIAPGTVFSRIQSVYR